MISQDSLKKNYNRSFVFWFCECLFSIVKDLLEYAKIKRLVSSEGEKVDRKELQSDVSYLSLDIIKNIGDCVVALGRLRPDILNQQQIGALGTITSVIGIYQLFLQH